MKKFLKITGITLLVLIVLLVSLPFLFKGKLIALAKAEANKNLNARVDFGNFNLSIISSFPDFRFSIDSVRVVGVGEFEKDTLAFIKNLRTDVNIMSVIKGDQIKIIEIVLDGPRINAMVMHDGKTNWDITKPGTDTTKKAPADTSKTQFKLSLKNFEIKKAQITYNDMKGNMSAALYDFDFKLAGDFTQDNFVMNILSEIQKMNFSMGGVTYAKNMHIKLKTDLDADMPAMKFTFKENEININELGLGVDGYVAMPDTNINMDLKFFAKQTEFKNILSLIPAVYSKDFATVQTAGKLALNGFAKGTYNASSLPAFGLHLEITEAMFKYPSLPKSVSNINIITDIQNPNGKPDATIIDVNKFHIEMAGNPVDMIMHVKTPVSDPNLHGEIKGTIDLTSVKDIVPLEKGDDMSGVIKADVKMQGKMSSITKKQYEDFKAAGTLEVDKMNYKTSTLPYSVMINEMKLNFTPQVVELTIFDSKLGNSDIKMQGKIENFMQYIFQDSLIKGNFTLNSNLIDLDQLMSSSTTTTTTTTTTTAATSTATPGASTVTAVPANIDFVLNTDIKKMLYSKMEITNVAGNVAVRNARASMQDVKMNLLDGTMLMSGYYDTKNMRRPAINFNLNANDFDIQKTITTFNTVKTLAPIANAAHGKFTATLNNFTGILKPDMSPDLTTLTGNGVFQTRSVAIQDYPAFVKLDDALHLNKLKNITVNDVNLSYEFKDGRVSVKPFKLNIAGIPAEISGSTGFDQTIDYKWTMEVPTKLMGAQGQQMAQGLLNKAGSALGTNIALPEKINITAFIGGTVTKPTIKTGLKGDKNGGGVVEQTKAAVVAEVKQTASQQAEKLLADAQKQADALKADAAKLSQQARDAGYKAADSLVSSISNPLAKVAAKKAAEKMKSVADAKAQKINDEASAKADKIMADAHGQADKLK